MALIEKLTAIADAIRSKTGKTNKITLDQMPSEIEGIEVYEGVELPELGDTAAQPADIVIGKVLYDDEGNPVTGELAEILEGKTIAATEFVKMEEDKINGIINTWATMDVPDAVVRRNSIFRIVTPLSEFGDAEQGHVLEGVTFTSSRGLRLPGTMKAGGGDNTEFIKMLDRSGDTITIPDGCTAIGDYAFYSHSTLTSVQIPDTVTNIGNSSFYQCSKLAEINIPVNLNILGTRAFYNCRGLTSVTFRNTPTSIANNSFGACTNLKTINVPWEYGAVENAPWGATSATINYNYRG